MTRDPMAMPSDVEWLDELLALPPGERLARVARIREGLQVAHDCFLADHESRIREAEARFVAAVRPTGAQIEVLERDATTDDTPGGSIVVPNMVRINGHLMLTPPDEPITVHETSTYGQDAVKVTMTVYARRVIYGAENDV